MDWCVMKARLVILFGFTLLILLISTTPKAMPIKEFEKLRTSIRQSYASSPQEGLEFVNALIETTELTLEQKIIVTNYKAWFLLETDKLEQAMETIVKLIQAELLRLCVLTVCQIIEGDADI